MTKVVDLFCGVGGMTHGFLRAGLEVIAGIDIDKACKFPYEKNNPGTRFYDWDVHTLESKRINDLFPKGERRVLVGCAPCQTFSKHSSGRKPVDDNRWELVGRFADIIAETLPDVVSMENVENLKSYRGGSVYQSFVDKLVSAGYDIDSKIVYCPDYGIPQTRKRLVLLASRLGKISLSPPTHQPEKYPTVREFIGGLPPLDAGQVHSDDPLHRARSLKPINLQRIRASTPGGTWSDWAEELHLECHKRDSGKSYDDVYGRMIWDRPAPTLTTQFFNYGTGRFGHPEQDRALSLREGALLQTFPSDYYFTERDEDITLNNIGRMIGNAVPVALAEIVAKSILSHLEQFGGQHKQLSVPNVNQSEQPQPSWDESLQ
jgi:DNA (cytosine-5)-methyltransferase 1